MSSRFLERHAFWLGCAAVLVVGVLLGVRSERAVSSVLEGPLAVKLLGAADSQRLPDEARMAYKDSLLAGAQMTERDPFDDPPRPRRPAPVAAPPRPKPVVKPKPPTPHLQALLFDHVDPAVQLRVSGRTSDWLTQGEKHEGWQILRITARSVTVFHVDGDTLTLP